MALKKEDNENSEEKEFSKEKILEDTKRKIEYLVNKNSFTEIEVYELVKFFFKRFLKKDHELTCEELTEELGNVYLDDALKADFRRFLDEVYLMEYSNKEFTQEELGLLVKEFGNLVEQLLAPVGKSRKSGFSFFMKKLGKQKEFDELEKKLKEIEHKQGQKASQSPYDRIQILLDKVNLLINSNNLDLAKKSYKELILEYDLSHKDVQKRFYTEVSGLFAKLQSKSLALSKSKV